MKVIKKHRFPISGTMPTEYTQKETLKQREWNGVLDHRALWLIHEP